MHTSYLRRHYYNFTIYYRWAGVYETYINTPVTWLTLHVKLPNYPRRDNFSARNLSPTASPNCIPSSLENSLIPGNLIGHGPRLDTNYLGTTLPWAKDIPKHLSLQAQTKYSC
jgi:hypothetical protein